MSKKELFELVEEVRKKCDETTVKALKEHLDSNTKNLKEKNQMLKTLKDEVKYLRRTVGDLQIKCNTLDDELTDLSNDYNKINQDRRK